MTSIKNVAVAGASGSLGEPLVKELLKDGFSVTALTRPDSTATFPEKVRVAKVDYEDVESLTSALKGQDAVVSTVATVAVKLQENLVDAAVAAGVKRLIPSEFGCDMSNPRARALPAYAQKVKIEEYVEKKCKGTQTSYTFIFNNAFLDFGLDRGIMMDLKGKKIDLYDGGNNGFTVTPMPFVGAGIVGVLKHPEETSNRNVRLHGRRVTQKQLLEMAQKFTGKDGWQSKEVSSADLQQESYDNLKKDPSNVYGWVLGFLKAAAFTEGFGGDYSQNNDNATLGLTEMSEQEVEDYFRARL